ncbi:MAG: hypothetical protein AAFX03_02930 [Pseudomonadota bacterium]
MPLDFISVDEAAARDGLRMAVVAGTPSPWGEGAKGIFRIKGLDWAAVKLVYDDPAFDTWAGQQSAPVLVYNDEKPRSGWAEILLLAERLAPEPALIPADPGERALMFGLAHELYGEGGLGWVRRLQLVHWTLTGADQPGFAPPLADYIGGKYGYTPEAGAAADTRVHALLGLFADRLKAQAAAGGEYLIGEAVTAVDVYAATTMALFQPLPEAQCPMKPATRAAFEALDAATRAALDPVLLAHRDMMYDRHLGPVEL